MSQFTPHRLRLWVPHVQLLTTSQPSCSRYLQSPQSFRFVINCGQPIKIVCEQLLEVDEFIDSFICSGIWAVTLQQEVIFVHLSLHFLFVFASFFFFAPLYQFLRFLSQNRIFLGSIYFLSLSVSHFPGFSGSGRVIGLNPVSSS